MALLTMALLTMALLTMALLTMAILPYLLWQVRFETASVAVRDTLSQLDEVAAHTDAADSQQHRQLQEAEAAATGD